MRRRGVSTDASMSRIRFSSPTRVLETARSSCCPKSGLRAGLRGTGPLCSAGTVLSATSSVSASCTSSSCEHNHATDWRFGVAVESITRCKTKTDCSPPGYFPSRLFIRLLYWFACVQRNLHFLSYADTIRYDTRCYFNVRSKADISQLNLPHGTDN